MIVNKHYPDKSRFVEQSTLTRKTTFGQFYLVFTTFGQSLTKRKVAFMAAFLYSSRNSLIMILTA